MIQNLRNCYKEYENRFSPKGIEVSTYHTPVNFEEAMQCPIHRWLAYKEGFSPSFVKEFILKYSNSVDDVVFDPYGGVGTTVLSANELNRYAISLDVSPLGNFASEVKNASYNEEDLAILKSTLHQFSILEDFDGSDKYAISPTVVGYFAPITYVSIIKVKNFIESLNNSKVHNIFLLSLISLLESVSTHKKNGNGVKRKIHEPFPMTFTDLRDLLVKKIKVIISDIEGKTFISKNTIVSGSCLSFYILPKKADIIITSPPYANCFDYSKVYLVELWMSGFFKTKEDQRRFREKSMISHVHYQWKRNIKIAIPVIDEVIVPLLQSKKLWSNRIPQMIAGYFYDLYTCLKNLTNNINDGAILGLVVGNPTYAGVVVATDMILADIATTLGYTCLGIQIYRRVVPSSQQTKLIEPEDQKYVRESLVVLQWKKK